MRKGTLPLKDRFWAKVDIRGPDECWPWKSAEGTNTYGTIGGEGGRKAGSLKTHRVAYELSKGPIPEGLWVLHSCDNRPCCNPKHLRAGTQKDNHDDMDKRGRRVIPLGSHNGKSKLKEDQVREIRRKYHNKLSGSTALSREYGVHINTITAVITNVTWRHIL